MLKGDSAYLDAESVKVILESIGSVLVILNPAGVVIAMF
jgi:hypothetical protein